MIIIQPSGGLCNRIRSINSAATLARKKGVPLKVLWLNAPELNCPFEELFLPTDEFELINIHSLNNPKKLFLQLTARQRFNNEDILKNKTGDMLNEDFYEKLSDSVYIFTWEQFYPTEDYHLFAFIRAMKAEIAADPEVRFFLATDEKKEEAILREHFGEKLLTNENRVIDRNSVQGMHDAMIDLFSLAATDKILGSYWSSFTDVAASMRGIPKVIVGEDA